MSSETKIVLTDHERALLRDLRARPKGLDAVILAGGILGAGGALLLFSGAWLGVLLAALGGVCIGVYFEKRYLGELKSILLRLLDEPGGGGS